MDIEVAFVYNGAYDHIVAERVLFYLVSQGAKYNAGERLGYYGIIGENVSEEIHCHEDNPHDEMTEKIADILDQYRMFEPTETSLTIFLEGPEFPFFIVFIPHSSSDGKTTVHLQTAEQWVEDSDTYERFIALAESLCRRFPFIYGAHRSEHMPSIPHCEANILTAEPQAVLYYGPELVKKIGAERLLSAPAMSVRQHDDGGVFLVACYDRYGGRLEIEAIKAHLGI